MSTLSARFEENIRGVNTSEMFQCLVPNCCFVTSRKPRHVPVRRRQETESERRHLQLHEHPNDTQSKRDGRNKRRVPGVSGSVRPKRDMAGWEYAVSA